MKNPIHLKDAIIYQVYPQSFQDSNGDGIGDLPGLTGRLDYIRSLGVDVLWLNPCFDSPFGDAGYDVRDFCKVAPRYGTEADILRLFDAAHARGLRVILDLVAGHTSMDHARFLAEAADPKSPDANRYIWKNRDFDPATGPTREDFVGNFFWYQPALNYGYAEVSEPWQDPVDAPGPRANREELRRILAYWFDRGCDGFRVDMAGSLIKPMLHPKAIEETGRLWRELRQWLDARYPGRLLFAEWSQPNLSLNVGFDLDFLMHFNAPGYPSLFFNGSGTLPPGEGPCYFHRNGQGSLETFRAEYARQLAETRGRGLISLPVANHDFQRLLCGPRREEELRCAWVFFMTQAGPPTIYYGEEIGMRFIENSPPKEGSTLEGITAVNAGTDMGERSGTRTPMQWDDSPNAGFSTAAPEALYLPLDPDPDRPTVAAQEASPDSLLHFVRRLIALRKARPALGSDGAFTLLNPKDQPYPMLCLRELDGEACLVALNPSEQSQTLSLPFAGRPAPELLGQGCTIRGDGRTLTATVEAFGYGIIPLAP
jgi:maltose alpha-D-glucosyltransferase/alpha-amylase